MVFGLSKKILCYVIIVGIPVLCIILTMIIHDVGRYLYMKWQAPVSRGVGLGFVSFYFIFFIFPSFLIISCLRIKVGIAIVVFMISIMYLIWFNSNPLRVLLMSASSLPSYALLFYCKYKMKVYLST